MENTREEKKKINIKMPAIKMKSIDWSKWNFRKFNWLTIVALLSYLNILVFIPLLFVRKSPFVQFHARQGLALFITTGIFLFSFYVLVLPWLCALFVLVCIIIGIMNVFRGLERPLPLIGRFAK